MVSRGMPHISVERKKVLELFARYVSVLPWFNINVLHKFYINVFLHFEKADNLSSYKIRAITCADLLHSPKVKPISFNVFALKNEVQQSLRIEAQKNQKLMRRTGEFMLAYAADCREHFLGPKYLEAFRLKGNMIVDPDMEAGRIVRNIAREINQSRSLTGKKNSVAYILNILNKENLGPEYAEIVKVMEGLQSYDPESGIIPDGLKSLRGEIGTNEDSITIQLPRQIREKILEELRVENRAAGTGTLFSVFAGIDRYLNERIYPLEGAFRDAQEFQQHLASNRTDGGEYRDLSFYNEQATRANLISAFERFSESAKPGDTFLFYFAGYGGMEGGDSGTSNFAQQNIASENIASTSSGEKMLVCHDSLAGTYGISLSELEYLMSGFPKDCKCVAILDCGFERQMMLKLKDDPKARSLAMSEPERDASDFVYSEDTEYNGTADFEGIFLFASNDADNVYETKDGGYFTTGLIDALKRANNQISFSDLISGDRSIRFESTAQSPTLRTKGNFDSYAGFLADFLSTESSKKIKVLNLTIDNIDENGETEKTIRELIDGIKHVRITETNLAHFHVTIFSGYAYLTEPDQPYQPLAVQLGVDDEEYLREQLNIQIHAALRWSQHMGNSESVASETMIAIEWRKDNEDWKEITEDKLRLESFGTEDGQVMQTFEMRIRNLTNKSLRVGVISLGSDIGIANHPFAGFIPTLQPAGTTGDTADFYQQNKNPVVAITMDDYQQVYNWKNEVVRYFCYFTHDEALPLSEILSDVLQPGLRNPVLLERRALDMPDIGAYREIPKLPKNLKCSSVHVELANPNADRISGLLKENLEYYLEDKVISPFLKKIYPELNSEENYLIRIAEADGQKSVELDLSELGLDHFPPEIFALTQLKSLDLSNNKIDQIPKGISQLKELEELIISGNPISIIHENIGQLERLRSLHLDNCELERFPKALLGLKSIEELVLRNNFIKFVPYAIQQFSILARIDLTGNPVINIPEEYLECSVTEFIDYLSPFDPITENEQPLVLAVGLDYDEKLRNINPELEVILEKLKSSDVEVLDLYNPDGLNLCDTIYRNQDRLSVLHFAAYTMHELKLQDGTRQAVDPHEWAEMFSCIRLKQFNTKLVFLNCCESEEIINHLTTGNFMVAIGLPDKVEDQVAFEVTREFYGSMAEGKTIQESFNETYRKFAD